MKHMKGKLYGAGVGPGDPELLTLKAMRLIRQAEVIAVPGQEPTESVAYKIVKEACKLQGAEAERQFTGKRFLPVPMPMTKDPVKLEQSHTEGARVIQEQLDQGKDVVFLTLGDPAIYSTYLYVHRKISVMGYETEIVSGIPSFCAVAARLNIGLVERAEPLHVIPATYQTEEALKLDGTKVLMKAGKRMDKVKQELLDMGAEALMIENCGMPDEKIYRSTEEIPEKAGYYSLIIVKDKKE